MYSKVSHTYKSIHSFFSVWLITNYWVDLPVLYRRFSLIIYFIQWCIYINDSITQGNLHIQCNLCRWNSSQTRTKTIYFFFFRAAPMAYGSSWARGWVSPSAAGLHYSHSNARFEPYLRHTLQLAAMSNPSLTHWSRGLTCILIDSSRVLPFFFFLGGGLCRARPHTCGIWRFPC